MASNEADYACTGVACGRIVGKKNLTAKKVFFGDVGQDSGIFRARTVAWLCEHCLEKDKDYQFPARVSIKERLRTAANERRKKGSD